jgi:hypothetical protein
VNRASLSCIAVRKVKCDADIIFDGPVCHVNVGIRLFCQ